MYGRAQLSVCEYHREFVGRAAASIYRMIDANAVERWHGALAAVNVIYRCRNAAAQNARGENIEMFTCMSKSPRSIIFIKWLAQTSPILRLYTKHTDGDDYLGPTSRAVVKF